MSEKLGPMQFGQPSGQVFLGRDLHNEQNYSDKIAYEIDLEIQRIIKECYEKAKSILTQHRDKLDLIATTLLEVETLDAEQIKHLFEHGTLPNRDQSDEGNNQDNKDQGGNNDVKINIQKKDE
nr:putative cell division protein [Geobacillus stearothermophilus]